VLANSGELRNRAITKLNRAGIGASPFYPSAICDIPNIVSHMATQSFHRPRAEDLSRTLLTLPTHPLVSERDLDVILKVLGGMAAAEPARDGSRFAMSMSSEPCE
jgi:perosamine synthetase